MVGIGFPEPLGRGLGEVPEPLLSLGQGFDHPEPAAYQPKQQPGQSHEQQ